MFTVNRDMEMRASRRNNKLKFGTRIATHSILKELNNGCRKNLLLSPLSFHMAFNMLTNGSKGQTLQQLLHLLDSDSIAHLNDQSSLFMEFATTNSSSKIEPYSSDQSPGSSGNGPYSFSPGSGGGGPYSSYQDSLISSSQPHPYQSGPYSPYQNPGDGHLLYSLLRGDGPYSIYSLYRESLIRGHGPYSSYQNSGRKRSRPYSSYEDPLDHSGQYSSYQNPGSKRSRPYSSYEDPLDRSGHYSSYQNPSSGGSRCDWVFQDPLSGHHLSYRNPGSRASLLNSRYQDPFSGHYLCSRASLLNSRYQDPFSGSGQYSSKQNPSIDSSPTISLVNGIWLDQRCSLKQSFKQVVEDVYKAKAQSVDFVNKDEEARCEINSWAKEVSRGHIDPLISCSLKGAIIVLASALYFKGAWAQSFDASDTQEEDFHLLDGETVRIPFMKKQNAFKFYRSFEDFKLLKMEYKTGKDGKIYAMYIFLPHQNDGLQKLVQKFHSDPSFFAENLHLHEVKKLNKLWLPKLKYNYELKEAKKILEELGLDLPFRRNAELTEIVDHPENIFISEVIHKSYIEVNEEGTTATATTALILVGASAPRNVSAPPELNFVADHPFLFMIKEEVSGAVLFVGAALNPLQ